MQPCFSLGSFIVSTALKGVPCFVNSSFVSVVSHIPTPQTLTEQQLRWLFTFSPVLLNEGHKLHSAIYKTMGAARHG